MTHINEDSLLKYALEVLESELESARITEHLSICAECKNRFNSIKKDIGIIGSAKPPREIRRLPNPRQRRSLPISLIRIAAIFVMGIFIGLAASKFGYREPANVSGSYILLSPPAQSLESSVASDATEIPTSYYDSILKNR